MIEVAPYGLAEVPHWRGAGRLIARMGYSSVAGDGSAAGYSSMAGDNFERFSGARLVVAAKRQPPAARL